MEARGPWEQRAGVTEVLGPEQLREQVMGLTEKRGAWSWGRKRKRKLNSQPTRCGHDVRCPLDAGGLWLGDLDGSGADVLLQLLHGTVS